MQGENNKGTDQSAQMRRLVCTFVVRVQQSHVYSQLLSLILSSIPAAYLLNAPRTINKAAIIAIERRCKRAQERRNTWVGKENFN